MNRVAKISIISGAVAGTIGSAALAVKHIKRKAHRDGFNTAVEIQLDAADRLINVVNAEVDKIISRYNNLVDEYNRLAEDYCNLLDDYNE